MNIVAHNHQSRELLSSKISHFLEENRRNVLIIDDSLFSRARSKKVELLAKAFDHVKHKYTRGYSCKNLYKNKKEA